MAMLVRHKFWIQKQRPDRYGADDLIADRRGYSALRVLIERSRARLGGLNLLAGRLLHKSPPIPINAASLAAFRSASLGPVWRRVLDARDENRWFVQPARLAAAARLIRPSI